MANIVHRARMRRQEEIRAMIPTEALMRMGAMMVQQGRVPILDNEGNVTGEFEKVEMPERMKLWAKLMDKGLTNTPANEDQLGAELPDAKHLEAIVQDPDRLKAIDTGALREVAQIDYEDTDSENVDPEQWQ